MYDARIVGRCWGDYGALLQRLVVALTLSVGLNAPARTDAANAQTAAPTIQSYEINWKVTAHGKFVPPQGGPLTCAFEQSSSTQGTAVVRFKSGEHGYPVVLDSRLITGTVTDEKDRKDYIHWAGHGCPTYVGQHTHLSFKPLPPIIGMDWWWMRHPPEKLPDGSWVLRTGSGFPGPEAYNGKGHQAAYERLFEVTTCEAPCTQEGPYNVGCVAWGPPVLHTKTTYTQEKGGAPQPLVFVSQTKREEFDVKSSNPAFFSAEHEMDVPAGWACGTGSAKETQRMKWAVTVRSVGPCRASGVSPLVDSGANSQPDITDEDVKMDVEQGGATIDPDSGVAPLNIRVTCEQVPVKNADVKIQVVVQPNTGGHLHSSAGRPRGILKWSGGQKKLTDTDSSVTKKTDASGRIHLTFIPGKAVHCPPSLMPECSSIGIAGIYNITATSVRFPLRKAEVAVHAEVNGLSRLVANPNYVDNVSASTHTSGDNATAATQQRLAEFASDFHDAQVEHNVTLAECKAYEWLIYPLWVIDVSLPYGGLYDLGPSNGPVFWGTPHQTHGRGDGVDFSDSSGMRRCPTCVTAWPDNASTIPVCGGTRISTQWWLMMKMWELGDPKYGYWDQFDLAGNPQRWHLHVKQ